MVEFSIVLSLLLVLTGGIVEFAWAYFQWNSATKALQQGLRLASVSNPVASDLSSLTGLEQGAVPGDPMYSFERVCRGDTQSCTNGTYDPSAMNTLVYGRGQNNCGGVGADGVAGMCDIYWRIRPENVIISYKHTGLGFAGRPGGPVPTITIELTGLSYSFLFLDGLLGLMPINLPPMKSTVTGEDLASGFGT